MANKIQIRRDTAANWTSANPTLSQGEQGYETDTGKLKIGDGSTAWTSLGYSFDVSSELYAESPSSPTTPLSYSTNGISIGSGASNGSNSITRTDAIAIGTLADAQTTRSIAIGYDSLGFSFDSLAIGRSAEARGSNSTSVGRNSFSFSGSYATALTNSYASGADSLAAAITNNTSTYGATGANSIAIGQQAKATGIGSVALGYGAPLASGTVSFAAQRGQATGNGSIAMGHFNSYGIPTASGLGAIVIGDGNTGSATRSVVLGNDNTSSHADAVVIGSGASSSAADEITLGHTDQTVRISSSYTLPSSDGTNGQVLTTDGSGAVTFADAAGGGADLYAANESSPTAQPSATGANAIAIGDSATASGADAVAIGDGSTSSSTRSIAIGYNSTSSGITSTALGPSANASGFYGTALGYNARAASGGFNSVVAVGTAYASGADSFAAAIANNTSSYGATGANSVAIGRLAKATGSSAHAFGSSSTGNIASGNNSFAIGTGATASATGSRAMGSNVTADGYASIAKGAYADVNGVQYREAYGFGTTFQRSIFVLQDTTSDATATILSTNGNAAAISAATQITLPNNSVYGFTGTVIAREDSSSTDDFAVWEIKGGAVRGASASTTALGSYNINKISESTGATNWSIALSADTTNGAVAITVTGEAAHNIRWAATVNTTEVTY